MQNLVSSLLHSLSFHSSTKQELKLCYLAVELLSAAVQTEQWKCLPHSTLSTNFHALCILFTWIWRDLKTVVLLSAFSKWIRSKGTKSLFLQKCSVYIFVMYRNVKQSYLLWWGRWHCFKLLVTSKLISERNVFCSSTLQCKKTSFISKVSATTYNQSFE